MKGIRLRSTTANLINRCANSSKVLVRLSKLSDASAILTAEDLNYTEVVALEQLESQSPDQQRAIAKFHLKDFYGVEDLTIEDIISDREGRWRGELLNLEAQLYPDISLDRTVKALEKQASWRQNLCPWDIPGTQMRREIRDRLGLTEFIRGSNSRCRMDR